MGTPWQGRVYKHCFVQPILSGSAPLRRTGRSGCSRAEGWLHATSVPQELNRGLNIGYFANLVLLPLAMNNKLVTAAYL